jgi:hypothetical protein
MVKLDAFAYDYLRPDEWCHLRRSWNSLLNQRCGGGSRSNLAGYVPAAA